VSVCVCGLRHKSIACKGHGPCYIVISGQVHPAIEHSAYIDARKKYHKTACTSLPEDELLDVRNISKLN
jgi:hypothetical protein